MENTELKKRDKINEACEIINGLRDNTILLGNSRIHQLPDTICIVYTAALDKVLSLLGEVTAEMEKETEEAGAYL